MSRGPRRGQRGGIIFKLIGFLGLFAFLAVLYLVRHPVMRLAGGFWVVEDRVDHADVILVIGDDDYVGDRAFRAADLFRAGWAPVVVASGRKLRPYAGISELIAYDLTSDGVPATSVLRFDHAAADTLGEAVALRRFVAEKHWSRVLLVTSNYHTRRARYIFRKVFPAQITLSVAAARDSAYDPATWWQSRASLKIFFLESVSYCVAHWELRHPVT